MKLIKQSSLTILGVFGYLGELCCSRRPFELKSSEKKNTYCILVISLPVCNFYAKNRRHHVWKCGCAEYRLKERRHLHVCALYVNVNSATYHMTLMQAFSISLNRYLVINGNKLNDLIWHEKRKCIVFCLMWTVLFILNSFALSLHVMAVI